MINFTTKVAIYSSFIIHNSSLFGMSTLSHLDAQGNPSMVDVGQKTVSRRTARARSVVALGPDIMQHLTGTDIQTRKGPVFQTAIIAGTMAAKRTDDLIPLCHSLGLDNCQITITTSGSDAIVDCLVSTEGKTGVEMEALVGASVAALTIYDMCKALSHDIIITETKLMEKTGGKRDFKRDQD
ncbi:cyclic pyranopterin monophosphate synthase MoaC [Spirosoma terrae]|jgi:cyclic pyranopterin phosphate synthase